MAVRLMLIMIGFQLSWQLGLALIGILIVDILTEAALEQRKMAIMQNLINQLKKEELAKKKGKKT